MSVPYALSVFSGTRLFNRDLRLNNRQVNKINNNGNNGNGSNPIRGQAMEPRPVLPNASLAHQFQMQNPYGNNALRGGGNNSNRGPAMNNMMPQLNNAPLEFPSNSQIDYSTLLAMSAQMLASANGLNNMGNDNNEPHNHQSKMMHRHENRSHNQNSNYSRDRDRRNDRRRDRSRSRSRDRKDWTRNQRSDRRDRNDRGSNRRR